MKFSRIVRGKFLSEIKNKNLIESEDNILVAFSGGPDSVCLFHLLTTLRKKMAIGIGAAYVDHGLRPKEVKKEIEFAKKLAGEHNVSLYVIHLKVRKAKSGLEAAARGMRYAALIRTAADNSYAKIATAHTLSDQAETVLLNIVRSTGIYGIPGIPSKREIKDIRTARKVTVIRPLMGISRIEVAGYLRENRLKSMTDTTNYDTRFSRNLVRLKIMPLLEKLNPDVALHLSNIASWSQEAQKCLGAKIRRFLSKISRKRGRGLYLDLSGFLRYNYYEKAGILRDVLKNYGAVPSINQIHEIIKLASDRGKSKNMLDLGGSLFAVKTRDFLAFERKNGRRKTV